MIIRFLSGLAITALAITMASAYDTKEHDPKGPGERHKWLSIYNCLGGGGGAACIRNEHEQLAQRALDLATQGHEWGIGDRTDFRVVDLNASLFRPNLSKLESTPATPSHNRPLEERILPAPPHFAGIPDFSYTIYDWANKNELCPSRPANDQQPDYCHVYGLWHGAGFNSSHFGSQATRSYQQLHSTAISLAADAARMLQATNSPAERRAHEAAIREAELLALAYEATAQHFLSDRWAVGHMFNRWGAPEYNANAYGDNLGSAVVTGLLTGIIHGYESVAGEYVPDALSSPEYLSGGIFSKARLYTPEWRFSTDEEIHEGVGDYRLQDMEDGFFGKEYAVRGYTDYPLSVQTQQSVMMRCLAASFGEIIRNFASNPDGPGFGLDGVQLTAAGQEDVDDQCFDPWATNFAMNVGWGVEGDFLNITGAGVIARYAPSLQTEATADELGSDHWIKNAILDRAALVKASAKIAWRAYWEPNGIDLAQGGIGAYGSAQTGDKYPVASYFEPTNLNSLPDTDRRGKDKESIFGLFNRAKAGYFCGRGQELLNRYRGSTDDKERAACRMLAHRMYASTWEDYEGSQKETQSVSFAEDRTEVRPLCALAPGGWNAPSSRTDDSPYRLHPGYVPWNASAGRSEAFEADNWRLSTKSIAAWCDAVPVIDPLEDPEDKNEDIVARVSGEAETISLKGLNFGTRKGRLLIGLNKDNAIEVEDIRNWRNDRITFRLGSLLDQISFTGERRSFIFVERPVADNEADPGATSVGRFALKNDIPLPSVVAVKIARNNKIFMRYKKAEKAPDDPGAFADDLPPPDAPEPFRPIDPGPVTVEVTFDRPMDREAEGTLFRIGSDQLTGEWVNRTRWRGRFELLAGDFFHRRIGLHPVHIYAKADKGGWIDVNPEQPGAQADESLLVLIDTVPVIVNKIEVRSGRNRLYRAEWIGGPDLDKEPNLTAAVLNDPRRSLSVADRSEPPPDGEGEIRIRLSASVVEAPTMTIGGVDTPLEGEDDRWRGKFDLAAVSQGMIDGRIPINISARDYANKGLDGDPRTVVQINSEADSNNSWVRFEDGRGGAENASGGADNWHFLSAPIDMSLAIILDASGSMGEGTGRLENAKAGIGQTLDNLPADKAIEAGAVIFYNCNDIRTHHFTRDIDAVKSFLLSATPQSATPLARAHEVAGHLFDNSADPASSDWRFSTFTDGEESCDGDVAGSARALNAKIREHADAQRQRPPPLPEPPAPLEKVECRPASWRGYQSETIRRQPSDTIRLIEHWYLERALPDGRCFARLETRQYGVYYGSGRAASGWGVNSRPSETDSIFGTSSKGVADLDRVRNQASAVRRNSSSLPDARNNISDLVRQQLERN